MSGPIPMYVAGRNDGTWGLPLLSEEWGDDRLNVARMATAVASDSANALIADRIERITALRVAMLVVRQHPADLNKALSEIDMAVRTGEIVLLTASALVSMPPEARESWLAHVNEKVLEALASAASRPMQSVDQG